MYLQAEGQSGADAGPQHQKPYDFVTLNPHTLDNQLLNLPVGGPTGRYTIGARSLTLANEVIGRGPTDGGTPSSSSAARPGGEHT